MIAADTGTEALDDRATGMDGKTDPTLGGANDLDANGACGHDARFLMGTVGEGDLYERPDRA